MSQDAMNDMAHKVVKKYPTKESSKHGKGSDKADDDHSTAAEFTQFMKRVQLGDTRVSNSEVDLLLFLLLVDISPVTVTV